LDGHRTHYSLPFVRYAVQNNILLFSYPGHSTHLLQPLDVVLFSPLQKAYGKAVHDHTRNTRRGVTKRLFWQFYKVAKKVAYTYVNIKAAWRATGIHPFNPDAVLVSLKAKHHNRLAAKHTSQPIAHTSPRSFLCYETHHKIRDVRRQVNTAVHFLESLSLGDNRTTASAVGVIRRLGRSAAVAITEAELEAYEKDTIKKRFGGKVGGRVTRQKLTSATVGDGKMLRQLEAAAQAKDDEKVEKERLRGLQGWGRARGRARGQGRGRPGLGGGVGGVGAHVRQQYRKHPKLR